MADNDPNKLFLAKLGQHKPKLVINLSKADEEDSGPADTLSNRRRHLGTTYRRRPVDEIIPHRPQKGNINFYDLAQIKDGGSWDDLLYTVDKTKTPFSFGSPVTWAYSYDPVTISDIDDLWDAVIAIESDLTHWTTKFRKIDYSLMDSYELEAITAGSDDTIYTGNPNWTPEGYKLASPSDAPIFRGNGFLSVGLNNSDYKLTSTRSYAAPAVSIDLSKATDVFLLPSLFRFFAMNRAREAQSPPIDEIAASGAFVPRRSFTLDNNLIVAPIVIPGSPTPTLTQWHDLLAQMHIYDSLGVEGTWNLTTPTTFVPGSYPSFPTQILAGNIDLVIFEFLSWPYNVTTAPNELYAEVGTLLGIAMQGTSVYYVWRKAYDVGIVDAGTFAQGIGFYTGGV